MSRKKFTADLLDKAHAMLDGSTTLVSVAKRLGVNADSLSKALRSNGMEFTTPPPKGGQTKDLPSDLIVSMYLSGMSELEVSKHFGVTRGPIRRRLLQAGVEIRGKSEASTISASRATEKQRKERTKAANDALRGYTYSRQELINKSIAREGSPFGTEGKGEKELFDALCQIGMKPVRQKSVDIYNVDIFVRGVAVELKSGSANYGPTYTEKMNGRIKKIAEHYPVMYICFTTVDAMMAILDEIVANINILSSQPPASGKYRMIGCRFQDYAIVRNERQQFARVDAPIKLHATIADIDY